MENANQTSSAVKSPPGPFSKNNWLKKYKFWWLVLVVIMVAVAAVLVWQVKSSAWKEYTNRQYGFKLTYKKQWGTPHLAVYNTPNGKKYVIFFGSNGYNLLNPPKTSVTYSRSLLMIDDLAAEACFAKGALCNGGPMPTKSYITYQLKNASASGFIKHDSNSYAVVSTYPYGNLQSELEIYKIVSLPKINASGVYGAYIIGGPSSSCQPNSLSNDRSGNCVSAADYNDFAKTINSLTAI